MKIIYNEYRFVKKAKKLIRKNDKKHGIGFEVLGTRVSQIPAIEVKMAYKRRHPLTSVTDINEIYANTLKYKYLAPHEFEFKKTKIETITITGKGHELVDKALWVFPIGLFEALWEKHGKIITGLIGLIIGLIPTIVLVIKRIMNL